MTRTLLLSLLMCSCFVFSSYADEYKGCEADNMVPGASQVWVNEDNGALKFVRLQDPIAMNEQEMSIWLTDILKAAPGTGFSLYEVRDDQLGMVHYRFRQTHNGYKVNNGVYYVHTRQGKVVSANGEFYPNISITNEAVLTAQQAIEAGKEHIHSHHWAWEDNAFPIPELMVEQDKDGTYFLAYKTDIYSYEPLDRQWLMIDAGTGKVRKNYNRIHTQDVPGEAHCRYHGVQQIMVDSMGPSSYRLRETERGGGINTFDLNEGTDYGSAVDFTDTDNVWDETANFDDAALDAHWGTEMMYDYFLNVHNWDSYDGNGTVMISYIHYGAGFVNAFWNGEVMTYGDGDGVNYFPLTSTEVVGHEIMHGITEFTASLVYADESGGLNESYSDCFGTILDFEINPLTSDYLIGDEFLAAGVEPFRSMENPNLYGNPDCYDGLYWDINAVHNRSGVQNFWFYLMTAGGTGTNDLGNDYTVNAIPMASVADILFRSLSTYMTPNSPYADARFYGIQSATDLFGDCSDEVINVTNAWYACGVGDLFDGAVVSNFNASSNYNCQVPATIQFSNNSVNGANYEWDFGNGTTSTDAEPTVIYDQVGTYTVSLIASGVAICGNADTLVLTDYITITNEGGPTTPACFPNTNTPFGGTGIFEVNFETIANPSDGSLDGYQDYTCTHATNVTEGLFYPFEITTGQDENLKIWIDVDGNGDFNNDNELVYESSVPSSAHEAQILIPDTDIYGEPIRMRIKSDFVGNDIINACDNVQNGQVEDYTLNISENLAAPQVDFTANETLVLVGSTIDFTDLTINLPNNWYWEFEGGVPNTSTDQHPSINYPTEGVYQVSLMASNALGEDTELKTAYITVTNIATMCLNGTSNASNGLFYDSGGANGPYNNNEFCTFLIEPSCANEVVLTFDFFDTETSYDFMYIYDGTSDSDPLIATLNGVETGTVVTATSGSMYVVFDSDFSVTDPGWEAHWQSIVPADPPVADFSISDVNPPLNVPVNFTDLTSNTPGIWTWDFGDGNASTEQNPSHAYDTPGTYTVTLTADNCLAIDVISYEITVQEAPAFSINPTSVNVLLDCGESVDVDLTMSNNGAGVMIFENYLAGEEVLMVNQEEFDDLNNFTNHTFEDLPDSPDSLIMTITLNGDFDNTGEFASLFIEGNFFEDIDDGNLNNGTDIVVEYVFLEADVAAWLSDGVLEVGIVNSGIVDDDQGGTNTHTVEIRTTGDSWVTINPEAGVLIEGTSTTLTLSFVSAGISAGIYTQDLEITTNDPNNPVVIIPITMEIVGEAAIDFSVDPCLAFPPTMQFTSNSLELEVFNDGCADLLISDIIPANSVYSVNATTATIEAGQSQMVTVTFSPTTVGNFDSDLEFLSNIAAANVCLTGSSFGAPSIVVDPGSINLTLDACEDEEVVQVTITNTGADSLIFSFDGGAGGSELEDVQERLNADFSSVTNLIPNFFEFFDGEVGNNISDGGGDMYDGGNFLSVDNGPFLDYSNDVIVPNAALGTDGRYFTRKYPGLFVFAADIDNVDLFSIDGNLGADGAGNVDGASLQVQHNGANYRGYVKRVYDSFDPSVNHLIITRDNGNLNQQIPNTTQEDDHDVSGLNGNSRIYYLLFAGTDSDFYDDNTMLSIMTQFLQVVEVNSLVDLPDGIFSLASGASQTFDFTFTTNNTDPGVYNFSIFVNSNDPLLSSISIPVTLTVEEPTVDISIDNTPVTDQETMFSSSASDAVSWQWDFGDGGSSSMAEPTHTYTEEGVYTVTLTVTYANGCMATTTTEVDVLINDVAEIEAALEIYPNPTDGKLYIRNTGDDRFHAVEIFNSLGQLIQSHDTSTFGSDIYEVELSVPAGVYYLTLRFDENQTVQKKIIVQR